MESQTSPDINTRIFEFKPSKRSGTWKIEIPDNFEKLKPILEKVLPFAMEQVHPMVRQMNVRVFFAENMIKKDGEKRGVYGAAASGNYKTTKEEKSLDIVVSLSASNITKDKNVRSLAASQMIMHEFFETDYWIKSRSLKDKPEHKTLNDPNYRLADHEIIADRKTMVCMQAAEILTTDIRDDGIYNNVKSEYVDY